MRSWFCTFYVAFSFYHYAPTMFISRCCSVQAIRSVKGGVPTALQQCLSFSCPCMNKGHVVLKEKSIKPGNEDSALHK